MEDKELQIINTIIALRNHVQKKGDPKVILALIKNIESRAWKEYAHYNLKILDLQTTELKLRKSIELIQFANSNRSGDKTPNEVKKHNEKLVEFNKYIDDMETKSQKLKDMIK